MLLVGAGALPLCLGVSLGAGALSAAAALYPALWRSAGLAIVLGVGAITAPLERRRRDHTAHTAVAVP